MHEIQDDIAMMMKSLDTHHQKMDMPPYMVLVLDYEITLLGYRRDMYILLQQCVGGTESLQIPNCLRLRGDGSLEKQGN